MLERSDFGIFSREFFLTTLAIFFLEILRELIVIIAGAGIFVLILKWIPSSLGIFLGGAVLGITVIAVLFMIRNRKQQTTGQHFKLRHASHLLHIKNAGSKVYQKRDIHMICIRRASREVSTYRLRCGWSGKDSLSDKMQSVGYKLEPIKKIDRWSLFRIKFGAFLKWREPRRVTLEAELEEPDQLYEVFVGYTVYQPFGGPVFSNLFARMGGKPLLELRIRFDKDVPLPKQKGFFADELPYYEYQFTGDERSRNRTKEVILDTNNRELVWPIYNPKFMHYYRLGLGSSPFIA